MPFTGDQRKVMDLMYTKAQSCKDDAKLVQIVYKMMSICIDANEAYVQNIEAKSVGIHPTNRSGKFMKDTKMHKKGYKIFKVGFTRVLCKPDKAVCFEEDDQKSCETHTMQITSRSKMFGQYVSGTIRVGSVGCSHLNQWIHAGNCGAETPYPDLCEPGKKTMSKYIMVGDNEELDKVMENGLAWTVMKKTLVSEYGYVELPSIFQRGLNVEHHIGEGDLYKTLIVHRLFLVA